MVVATPSHELPSLSGFRPLFPLSPPLFVEKDEKTGTEVSLSPVPMEDSFAVFQIQNGSFQRRYVTRIEKSGLEREKRIASQIFQLDPQTMEKLPKEVAPRWTLMEEPILAALQSENPEMRAKGERWLFERNKDFVDTSHQDAEKLIGSYFDELEKWEKEPFESADERMRNWERGFFAITDREFSSLEEEAQTINSFLGLKEEHEELRSLEARHPSSEEEKQQIQEEKEKLRAQIRSKMPFNPCHAILRALWFPNHPYHAKCKALLQTGEISDLPSRYLPLLIHLTRVPHCILDRLELPEHTRTFPQGETREQVLAFYRQDYERELKALEGREEIAQDSLPPLKEGEKELIKSNEATGTAISAHYFEKEGRIFGLALITNGPQRHFTKIYSRTVSEEKIQQLADRILQLDRSAIKALNQQTAPYRGNLIFAGLLSENLEVRAKAVQWLAEEREEENARMAKESS